MATATVSDKDKAEFFARLATDTPFLAENCFKIVDKNSDLVPLLPKDEQLRLDAVMEEQRREGVPIRVIILKARQIGFSTWVQAKLIQHVTQLPNRRARVVAQDTSTASRLFEMSKLMYQHMPAGIKPPIAGQRKKRSLELGVGTKRAMAGEYDHNSSYDVDTANEFEGGRGQTFSAVHASEVAMWPDIETKLLGLLSAVPKKPGTMVVLESTAKGNNFFRDMWDRAVEGKNGYAPFFSAWWRDPEYSLPFLTVADRKDFESVVGEGPYGEDEPYLVEQLGLTLEQLHWRRFMIDQPEIGGDVRNFHQEYPSTPEEAFITTGQHVFDQHRVQIVVDRCLQRTDPKQPTAQNPGPELGVLVASSTVEKKGRHGKVEVPTGVKWTPQAEANLGARHPFWRVWDQPQEDGRYIVVCDASEGEEVERGESDFHGIQVIDHNTRKQVARYRSRIDPDLVGDQVYLAALHWNHAIIVVEKTGGYGMAMLRRIYFDYKYPRPLVYFRRSHDSSRDREEDRLGWSTDRATKPLLVTTMTQVLREATDPGGDLDVVRDLETALEMTAFMRDERGRTGARKGRHDDLLMPLMIAHQVAEEMQPKAVRRGSGVTNMLSPSVRDRWRIR